MTFFESLLALLGIAIVLLQVARRSGIPYPALLAGAGVALAWIPGAPVIALDPHTALALFIAPVLIDAAYDFPVGTAQRLWRPLFALAVIAVLLSAGVVAWLGMTWAGLPFYAALALGAIVAPPDAAAATAISGSVRMPRRTVAVLKGESLLNDAAALLLFSTAILIQSHGGVDASLVLTVSLAAPGGIALGFALAWIMRRVQPLVWGTLSGNILQFVTGFGAWLLAERLHLSAVLCLVTFAMTIARSAGLATPPRARIHDFAVWDSAVFLLNVFAFLLMGFQARTIIGAMSAARLADAAWFAGAVVASLIVVRLAWVLFYNRVAHHFPRLRGDVSPARFGEGVLVGWCGMRGLVTLATAFALPAQFPQRDLIVLTAFAVVLATLVVQGLTLAPLVRRLRLDGDDGLGEELARARREMAEAALTALRDSGGPAADHWRWGYRLKLTNDAATTAQKRSLGLAAIRHQRERLEALRDAQRVGADAFLVLQEELDFAEVSLRTEEERRIEEA
ncbi:MULTISPECIES: cation:proton antiporter [unclassified Sphingomonas]|uniref:cation:proton antiporter n=1 Tax=unclassified Sphingomonas TaxID=196159 RepID=UPI001D0FD72D|nr:MULTISPECIES: cation:proton antiporter [unclassified Sphingomonas]MCC2980831.1 cation:proton antiporter [Sphingomonas sp. IC4-52]MCD2317315.1 cation:proton antiporter [Sphingomonas sp. IC-11]